MEGLMLFLVCGIAATINEPLAKRKHRSVGWWTVAAALTGPLSTIVLAILPENFTGQCPYCLSAIPAAATRCRHCAGDLTAARQAPARV